MLGAIVGVLLFQSRHEARESSSVMTSSPPQPAMPTPKETRPVDPSLFVASKVFLPLLTGLWCAILGIVSVDATTSEMLSPGRRRVFANEGITFDSFTNVLPLLCELDWNTSKMDEPVVPTSC